MVYSSPTVLPIVTIQDDFISVVSDVREGLVPDDKFWLSCYKSGEPSVHSKIHVTLDEIDRDVIVLQGTDGVDLKYHAGNMYSASCPQLSIPPMPLAAPYRSYTHPDTRRATKITAFDVAPDGSQFATGYHDGAVHISSASHLGSPPQPSTSKAHLSTVTSLRFFPSSRVLLTAGNDFTLNILPAEPPQHGIVPSPVSPARTLRGHTRAITSTAIISRGRNVLSGAKDGTLRLWDVPTGAQIRMLVAGRGKFAPIFSLSAGERAQNQAVAGVNGVDGGASADIDPREVDTSDQIVVCGLQDGSFEVFDLRTKQSVFQSTEGSSAMLNAVAYESEHGFVATGASDGLLKLYETRALDKSLFTFRRNTAPIEDLTFLRVGPEAFRSTLSSTLSTEDSSHTEIGLVIATEDGLPYIADVHPSGPSVRAELVGGNCDGVSAAKWASGAIWTAADDGVVRQYRA